MQLALDVTSEWCQEKELTINPNKTTLVPFTRRRNVHIGELKLGTVGIEQSEEMKYLGVILDRTLTWNKHLSYVTNKALRMAYACQRLYGKTWGLRPKMMAWSYRTIIVPMVTYGSIVWWPKVDQAKTQLTLNKINRNVCLGVTGALKTCPTAAMEVLTGCTPLHICVKAEAARAALRLPDVPTLKEGNLRGHVRILEIFWDTPSLAVSERMNRKLSFSRNFKVVISDRESWRNDNVVVKQGSQLWFTDGSKLEDGSAGAGIVGPNFQRAVAMGKTATVFQAEVHAIELCARECLRRNVIRADICILSDSQAALKALTSYSFRSRLVWECYEILQALSLRNKLVLVWIPGHEGHEGNERADCLAKRGRHCRLNYHLKKLKLVNNDSCRLCKEGQETAEHILCECPAAYRRRTTYFPQTYGSDSICK
ncbi:Retrovirus-related Pol polyprotein from type-1 retrotransposable element R1 4 [Eumeta japonica]|uniref:Retrovirus-related Pol polyprotein from type-1 retrotransposable element R1 4 n=1 Tax=Eumeta variegata TaxID=151549 RepID=A0A4C1TCF2_EUMVA|nr:Retrovirus-related Pol polyprotein from type-1 retrotransposable element R1 4 [Eumeta japonica]